MDVCLDIFSKIQYGIAALAFLVLVVGWLRPKVAALRASIAAKAEAATKSVAEASRTVAQPAAATLPLKAE